jgi:hypothetical protein
VPHVERPHRGRWQLGEGSLPVGGRAAAILVCVLAILILLLLLVKDAKGNFVYWTDGTGTTIGRAKINGTGPTASSRGSTTPNGLVVDSRFIYWAQGGEVGLLRVSAITARWVGCASSWAFRPASVTQAKIPRRS